MQETNDELQNKTTHKRIGQNEEQNRKLYWY